MSPDCLEDEAREALRSCAVLAWVGGAIVLATLFASCLFS